MSFDTVRWAAQRRPFERLEGEVVRMYLQRPSDEARAVVDVVRYALNFAKLGTVRNRDGADVSVGGPLEAHARWVLDTVAPRVTKSQDLWAVSRELPALVQRTRAAREDLLVRLPIDRESLEAEITTKKLAVASGGGGGAGYVYPGCYEALERNGIIPSLMVGTSMGALMSMFRSRRLQYDPAPLVAAAKRLAWSNVFRVLEGENRYGLPATLRLYLHSALGNLFLDPEGAPLRLSDMEIPMYSVVTGFTVDALKHDLDYYEHLIDEEVGTTGIRSGVRMGIKVFQMVREFLASRETLREVVLGREPGTEHFDVLDAAGFSAAIPGVIHYDVLRDAPEMKKILDNLYAAQGVTRLGEGGMVSNVPARIAWETFVSGRFGHRNTFVLALDCLAPSALKIGWYPLAQAVRSANVEADLPYSDLYITFSKTLSPMNLVPPVRDSLAAMKWGKAALDPHMPYIRAMMSPVPVL